jgi:plasmid stabilization system protein ParE
MADRVEELILEKFAALASDPGIGHRRSDLTARDVRFFPVYSYLIVYRPSTKPLQVVAVLHGARDMLRLLKKRV